MIQTTVYSVTAVSNNFSRQRVEHTDEDGYTWYRYDKPRYTYQIDKSTVVGCARFVLEGAVPDDEDYSARLYLTDGTEIMGADLDNPEYISCGWFTSEELADNWVRAHKEKHLVVR